MTDPRIVEAAKAMDIREEDLRIDGYRTERTITLYRTTHIPTGMVIEGENRAVMLRQLRARAAILSFLKAEPSEGMVNAAMDADGTNMMLAIGYDEAWKAMSQAAIKEIEG